MIQRAKRKTLYGYVRLSSPKQKKQRFQDRQIQALLLHGLERKHIFTEVCPGDLMKPPILQDIVHNKMQPGDELVVAEPSRLARKLKKGVIFGAALANKNCGLRFLSWSNSVDFNSVHDWEKLLEQTRTAQAELAQLNQNIQNAKKRLQSNKKIGRPLKIQKKQFDAICQARRYGTPWSQIAQMMDCCRTTVYRAMRRAEKVN